MKKTISILMIAAMLLSMVAMAVPAFAAVNHTPATPLDPTTVGNNVVNDLNREDHVDDLIDEGYLPIVEAKGLPGEPEGAVLITEITGGNKYYLTSNLSVSAELGSPENITIDGCGYSLTISRPLFGNPKNVTLQNITIKGSITGTTSNAGTILAKWDFKGNGTFKNVTVDDSFTITTWGSDRWKRLAKFAGFAGDNGKFVFENVYAGGDIKWIASDGDLNWGQSYEQIGGLVGEAKNSTFKNVVSAGNIIIGDGTKTLKLKIGMWNLSDNDDKAKQGIGGIAGALYDECVMENCVNLTNITFKDKVEFSDIVPKAIEKDAYDALPDGEKFTTGEGEATVYYSKYALGTVGRSNISGIGGAVGKVYGKNISLTNVVNKGAILMENDNGFTSTVKDALDAAGKPVDISATVHRMLSVGGVVGKVEGSETFTMTDCHNEGDITLTKARAGGIGGVIGRLETGANVKLLNCNNSGAITGTLGQPSDAGLGFGGIVGLSKTSAVIEVVDCDNSGALTATTYGNIFSANQYKAGETVKNHEFHTGVGAVGGIFGYQYANACTSFTVSNCDNTGTITHGADSDKAIGFGGVVGGIRGTTAAVVSDCTNSASLNIKGSSAFSGGQAGIVGFYGSIGNWMHSGNKDVMATLDIRMCKNTGNVSSTVYAGGIIGYNREIEAKNLVTTIYGCENTGNITSTGNGYVAGGIYGNSELIGTLNIEYCINSGKVTATGVSGDKMSSAGGVIGLMNVKLTNLSIKNTKNTGDVTGATRAAGIVSRVNVSGKLDILNCYNAGAVKADKDSESGVSAGIAGYISGCTAKIDGCINAGKITCAKTTFMAPITVNTSTIDASGKNYYLTGCVANGTTVTYGTAKQQSEITGLVNAILFAVKGDSFHLKNVVALAETLIESDYTTATWAPFKTAITAAKAVATQANPEQNAIDTARKNLEDAKAALDPKPLNRTEYDKAVADYNKIDKSLYAGATYLEMTNAVRAAEVVLNTPKALQSDFDKAIAAIRTALAAKPDAGETDGKIDIDENGEWTLPELRPTSTTPPATSESTTEATTTAATTTAATTAPKKKGCGGIIGGTVVVLTAVIAVGAGVSLRKKED